MKIIEAIGIIDELKPNSYSQDRKVEWLSALDSMVQRFVFDKHQGAPETRFEKYPNDVDPNPKLLVDNHDQMYIRWLAAQIDLNQGEYVKYNNSIDMFNAEWDNFEGEYNRTHKPLTGGKGRFIY